MEFGDDDLLVIKHEDAGVGYTHVMFEIEPIELGSSSIYLSLLKLSRNATN